MSTIDQQFVEYIVKSLVSNPDKVEIKRTIDEKGVLLELTVDPSDLGRVIGKRGSGAQSLRTLLRALGTKNDARYNLKIVDNGEAPKRESSQTRDDSASKPDKSEKAKTQPVEENEAGDDFDDITSDLNTSDSVVDKTRKELAELDDLEI